MRSIPRPAAPAMADLEAGDVDPERLNLHDYERLAAERIAPGPLAYFSGGAMDERSLRANREAFERRWLVPRVLTDVSTVDLSVEVLGQRWPNPFWICPMAMQRMAHPDGEMAVARAAAARGVTYVVSTSSSTGMEEIAEAGGRRWYQVYLPDDAGARRAMVELAVETGHDALVLTVDLQRVGRRERDLRVGFEIPLGIGLPNLGRAAGVPDEDGFGVPFAARITWDDVEWLAGFGLPLFVKGVLHPDDARLALEHGAAGIMVSNHGGRQLDGAIAALDALPPILDTVGGQGPVFVDGGVRRGTDALSALAMGATAVGIGRPILWGLSVDGEAGVGQVLDLLRAELELSMALAGAGSVPDLTPDLVREIA